MALAVHFSMTVFIHRFMATTTAIITLISMDIILMGTVVITALIIMATDARRQEEAQGQTAFITVAAEHPHQMASERLHRTGTKTKCTNREECQAANAPSIDHRILIHTETIPAKDTAIMVVSEAVEWIRDLCGREATTAAAV